MTIKRYLCEQALKGSSVLTAVCGGDRPSVRTLETWFHGQGGGQRGDRGTIGLAKVIDTRHGDGGEIDHFVDSVHGLIAGMTVELVVDAGFRRRSALLHSAGHLIAEAGHIVCPALTAVSGHHWDGEARVEFVGSEVDADFTGRLSDAVAELVARDLRIRTVGDPFTSRAIQIGSFEPMPCGGTHAETSGELVSLLITKTKSKGGRVRVSYAL
jgi:alanyl-tRNA synthetase